MALRAVVASFAVHASVAAGLVAAGRGGHATPGTPVTMTAEVLEIDTSTETVETPVPVAEAPKDEAKNDRAGVIAPPPDHTHPYPVAGHDARPHDPSQPHDHHASNDDDHDDDHDHDHAQGAPAAAAPVVANDSAKMPVFSIANGGGSMSAGTTRIADGSGNGSGPGSAAEADAAANVTYPANGVNVPAKLVASVTAAYPPDARADDVEGDVGLEIVVDGRGAVVEARVSKSAGHGFDESALAAIRRYRFSSAQREGRNVRVRMPWTVQFRLR